MPFIDPNVKLGQGWIYGDGGYHHALDFAIDGSRSFEVRAAAPGKVVFVGWDNWSGNTIVISHADSVGNADAFRTIYMHLRNGASHDCESAWNKSVPMLRGQTLSDYEARLTDLGCSVDPTKRNLGSTAWGADNETIKSNILGKNVDRGEVIAVAGDTGPGGIGRPGQGSPNIHLHIFFARKDPSDGRWYFFDPYGIYNWRSCYPNTFADPIHQAQAGYGIAWVNGKPQIP